MLNETFLLENLRIALGSKLFECIEPKWYINILNVKTLYLWSQFYPKLVKGVKITEANAIPTYDPINNIQEFHRYRIPKFNLEDQYIGIEKFMFNGQGYNQVYSGFNSPLADAAMSKIRALQPIPEVRWRCEFEAPDFCEVYPYRRNHLDFVLTMQRLIRMSEIPMGYHEHLINLFIADVKGAIYHEFPAARESGVLNGVEINTNISSFESDSQSERKDIISELKEDYFLDPSRFESFLSQS